MNMLSTLTDLFFLKSTLTFVPKAFEELEGLHKFMMSTTPSEILNIAKGAHKIIDTYADGSQKKKEELKAVLVLALGAPFMFDDITRFKTRYNSNVSTMVEDLVSGKMTADLAQISMALNAAQAKITYSDKERFEHRLEDGETLESWTKKYEEVRDMFVAPVFSSAPRLKAYAESINVELNNAGVRFLEGLVQKRESKRSDSHLTL